MDETDDSTTIAAATSPPPQSAGSKSKPHHISWSDSYTKAHLCIQSLSSVLPSLPQSLTTSDEPAEALLHDAEVAGGITDLLRRPESGAANDPLCAWLYDTFNSSEPDLCLVVLRFIPVLAGVYLSRAALSKPLAGFESVLLAIYAYETASRGGQAVTATIPDLSHPSIYHETLIKNESSTKNTSTELHLTVISPSLEPHGTMRSTRRARIVSVALELYYNKISRIPVGSKMEFCEICKIWSGKFTDDADESGEAQPDDADNNQSKNIDEAKKGGRINLPWELLQQVLRILGHCLMCCNNVKDKEERSALFESAMSACKSLHFRAMHDINPKAILATGSLLKLAEMCDERCGFTVVDHTEIDMSNVITV